MKLGHEAIKQLLSEFGAADPKASSHWLHYHQFLAIDGETVLESRGFGGSSSPFWGIRKLAHLLMQRRYRRMGKSGIFSKYDRTAREISAAQGRAYDLDLLRQALTISLVDTAFKGQYPLKPVVCIIGDGFGSLASLILASSFASRIILVNLTKTLAVDLIYLMEANPDLAIALPESREDVHQQKNSGAEVIAIRAKDFRWLHEFDADLVFNVVSMQEMNPEVIGEYFSEIRIIAQRREIYFYCCNREEKRLPDGTVTRFMEYPWIKGDEIYLHEKCPWHQEYYTVFPPGYHPYDGPILHRFVKMSADLT